MTSVHTKTCRLIFATALFFKFLFIYLFWLCLTACEILIPRPGIEPGPSAVKVQSPNHWTAREYPATALFLTAHNWKKLTCPSTSEWINKLDINGLLLSTNKEQTQLSGWISNALCYVKEAKLKKVHSVWLKRVLTVWFHSYDILEKAKV